MKTKIKIYPVATDGGWRVRIWLNDFIIYVGNNVYPTPEEAKEAGENLMASALMHLFDEYAHRYKESTGYYLA